MISSPYLGQVLTGKNIMKISKEIVKQLRPIKKTFDAIAIRGFSGALIGPTVAGLLNKDLVIVRKMTESSHSMRSIEGYVSDNLKYIIVDDFISSGNTIEQIKQSIGLKMKDAKLVGIVVYNQNFLSDIDHLPNKFQCWIKSVTGEEFVPDQQG